MKPRAQDPTDEAFRAFCRDFPAFASTAKLDDLRARDYARLERQGHVYLDYTGAGLPAASLLREHAELLASGVFGNPHSRNRTSSASSALVEQARARVLAFFRASPDEYTVIFTPNATGALKLVGEAYPFAAGGHLLLTADNHNSVNGIRELARARGARVSYVPLSPADLRADAAAWRRALPLARPGHHNLFAYPAQSNFSGVQHPLAWIAEAQEQGWDVLLDAASFVPSNRLDLGRWHPDFVDVSFYKMCGYPTGTGCLLARKQALRKLCRPWFAGGTVTFSSVAGDGHHLAEGFSGFEDGTVNFLGLPAVTLGLGQLEAIGMDTIHTRVTCLTGWLLAALLALRHHDGRPLIRLYGPSGTDQRGGTIELNVLDPGGALWDCHTVERLASEQGISLRAGCHCNPGAREAALGLAAEDLARCFAGPARATEAERSAALAGQTAGAVRASIGLVSTFADVQTFADFVAGFADRPAPRRARASAAASS